MNGPGPKVAASSQGSVGSPPKKSPGVIRVNRPTHFHHDHVAALRLVDLVETGGLVARFADLPAV